MEKINYLGTDIIVYKEVLSNGLEVYMVPNNKVNNFYITYNTKFGSLYTSFKLNENDKYINIPNGVAHFLEHLTFKMEDGTDAMDYFSTLGSSANAFTSNKITSYEIYGYDNFKENLKYLIKYVNSPYYTKENVEAEKGIIIEEIKMYEDSPYANLSAEMNKLIFKNDNRKYLVSGTVDDVKGTTLKNIKDAYNTFYDPSNMFIIITGNFNYEEAISIIMESYDSEVNNNIKPKIKKIVEPASVVCTYKEISTDVEISKVSIGIKIPKSKFNSLKLDDVTLKQYLHVSLNSNFGKTSILHEKLIDGNIIVNSIAYNKYFTDDYLIITLMTETLYPKRCISLLKEKLNNLEITEEELIRKKRVLISNFMMLTENIDFINNDIQSDIISYGKVINNIYDIYNNLNIDTINKVIKKLDMSNMAVLVLKRKDEEEEE